MLIGVLEVDEERTVHSFGVWGWARDRFTCAIDTARTKRKTFIIGSIYSLGGSFACAF
jgi:hypothetical protein